ncbi:MAG: hypothetical protein OIF35_00965, partial [Cellvibrionaceae bacterium]|nr:hypothetical protein [Cellvibrionaceae bacterium]
CKLQPTVPEHKGALEQANSHLMALNKQKAGMALKSLSNPRQIAGTRKNLKLLSKFFDQLAAKGSLNGARINEARMSIKNKMVLLATDEYDIQARNALGSGKHQLAAHYYTQANNILTKHNSGNTFNDSIRNHKDWIGEATKLAKAEQERLRAEKEALEADSKKWDDSDWKKKNFYD